MRKIDLFAALVVSGAMTVSADLSVDVGRWRVSFADEGARLSWFKTRPRPDAVICESDQVAMLLWNTLRKFGLGVPEDVMLAGFDDVQYAMLMSPPLTTVHQPCADIAKIAYRTLRERISDADLPPRRILLPAPLVVRDSTGQ